jgi:hypothetical protein
MLEPEALEELLRLGEMSQKAARGKWHATDEPDGFPETYLGGGDHLAERIFSLNTDPAHAGWSTYDGYTMRREDAEFAAACVNFVRALLGDTGEKA